MAQRKIRILSSLSSKVPADMDPDVAESLSAIKVRLVNPLELVVEL